MVKSQGFYNLAYKTKEVRLLKNKTTRNIKMVLSAFDLPFNMLFYDSK